MAKIYNLAVILLVHIGLIHGTTICKKDTISYVQALKKERISSTGEFTGLVILVEFSDTYFTAPNLKQNIDSMLNSRGYAYQGAKGISKIVFKYSILRDLILLLGQPLLGTIKLAVISISVCIKKFNHHFY